MDLTALTLTQLFDRQDKLEASYREFTRALDGCAPGSFDWDLHNAAATACMQDLADTASEITRRIIAQVGQATREHEPAARDA